MRRSASLLLCLALALGALAGCGDAGSFATDEFEPVVPGRLTVVTNLPAPGFWRGDTPGSVDGGYEWAIARELARQFGLDLRVRQVAFDDLVAGRVDGYDVGLSQVAITGARDRAVDFSVPYYRSDAGILTRAKVEVPDLKSARETSWVVQRGSVEADFLRDVVVPDEPVLFVDAIDDAVAAVEDGSAEAALLDTVTALAAAADSERLHVAARFALDQEFGVVLPSGSDNRIAVDQEIRRMKSSGMLDDFDRRWIRPVTGGRDPADVPFIVAKEGR